MKAIETIYRGYRFRSRLEARWAVFFNELNLRWSYEVEGYDLGDGERYLPDFWFPDLDRWIEIKPRIEDESWPDHKAWKADSYAIPLPSDIGDKLIILCGNPWWENVAVEHRKVNDDDGNEFYYSDAGFGAEPQYEGFIRGDNGHFWCQCPKCHIVGIEYEGRAGRLCKCFGEKDKIYNVYSPALCLAYTAAKQARFEHGENGIPFWRRHYNR